MMFSQKLGIVYLPLCILLIIASLNFLLLLRHKSPYVTDSYFYNHIFYEFQGNNFNDAYKKVSSNPAINNFDDLGKNFFLNPDSYKYSLSRYIRRPFYPFTAYLLNLVTQNEYLAFLIPVFVSYAGSIILIYLLFKFRFDSFWSIFGTALFTSFYPFLDWSTYFLTDTIGAFFWLLQIYLIFKYVKKPKNVIFIAYVASLIISLSNREQSILLFIVIWAILTSVHRLKLHKKTFLPLKKLFAVSLVISVVYLISNTILKQPSLYDSWIYLESNFGYNPRYYSSKETTLFLFNALVNLHEGLLMELIRHRWWAAFTTLGLIGAFQTFFVYKRPKFIDILMFSSGGVAYIGLIIVPFLSYRYFYPTIIGIIYFALHAIQSLFTWQKNVDS